MILIFEMICVATVHAATNSAMIQTIAAGFPRQKVRVFADASHLTELRSDPILSRHSNVSFQPVAISPHYGSRPQIVSFRRGLREFWTLLCGIRSIPASEPCLVLVMFATPTAILAAGWLARLMRRRIRVQVVLHGNLNDAFGWRTRNPVARWMDLHAALTRRHGRCLQFLVLEDAMRRSLVIQAPAAADTTDVLPHPISPFECEHAEPNTLTYPLRIGLVGQATEAKGISPFLTLAREFRQSHPDSVRFHLVGNAPAGSDTAAFIELDEPVPTKHLARPAFTEKLRRLHYVCLLLQPSYYTLSASGALVDAITWLRPVIGTNMPIIADLFARFGDIGELCDDLDGVRAALTRLVDAPNPDRYQLQVANLRRVRDSRLPAVLAADYRRMLIRAFPGPFVLALVCGNER